MNDRLSEVQTNQLGAGQQSPALSLHSTDSAHSPSSLKHKKKFKKEKKVKISKKAKHSQLETEILGVTEDGEFMADFFTKVGEMKKNILIIEETTHKLNSVTTQKGLDNMSTLLSETNCYIAQIRDDLLTMGKENTILGDNPKIAQSSEYMIRVNAFNSLKSKFFETARHYEESQLNARNKEKESIERRIKIVNPSATQEEVDEMIELGENVFEQKTLDKKRHAEAKEALEKVEDQRIQLHQLEQSIMELHQLFLDMALLVDEQGEMINVIEANVNKTVQYVAEANQELKIALKYSNSARKKVAFLVAGVVAGVAAGAGAIAAKFALIGV
ncbi:hypothetical protein PROFUN_13238 [Planoprotostelium fungivorum]|uniref:t-SNARE coiled-coil homology domain-containing protein n=1 Tax=Planoprotostelium fungivorum TaxID=1890364 RepID=A0A2P6N4S2_9EUKA|nr:hypothetical protein PROFUN_13238 [Planoprotostelium fungivorum]